LKIKAQEPKIKIDHPRSANGKRVVVDFFYRADGRSVSEPSGNALTLE
jgi:hypothetical protein